MAEQTNSAMSRHFYIKTSDLVQPIQNNQDNREFHIYLLIHRLDKAFERPPPLSRQQFLSGFQRKIPHSSVMDDCNTCKDNVAIKGILIVATIVESFETILYFRRDCWTLLEEMYNLAKSFYRLKDFPVLNHLHKIKNVDGDSVLSTIVEASNTCFFQRKEMRYDRLVLNLFKYRKDIHWHLHQVKVAHTDLGTQMLVHILRFEQRRLRIASGESKRKNLNRRMVEEKTEKEAIKQLKAEEDDRENEVKSIIKGLRLKSRKEKHLAMVIQGDSGECKTKLADAVYDRLEVELFFEGWKLHKKKLTESMEFKPDVEVLQSEIVSLFAEGKKKKTYNGKLSQSIENEPVFILIDNILQAQDLIKILDTESMRPNKVRLLVTSPNKSLKSLLEKCGFKCEDHKAKCVEDNPGRTPKQPINDPLLREMVSIHLEKFKEADEKTICEWVNKENLVEIGFKFALENAFPSLPATTQDAFLDICCFFLGWDWDEVSLIVGDAELQILEQNAWVKRNRNNQISVADSQLQWGQSRTKGVRVTSIDELQNALSSENISKIKGIWLPADNNQITIDAQKLHHMRGTLRVLSLPHSTIVEGNCDDLFPKLRYLQVCRSSRNFLDIRNVINMRYFRSDEDVYFDPSQLPPKLKVVKLCGDAHFKYHAEHQKKEWITWEIEDLRTLNVRNFQKLSVPDPKIFSSYDRLKKLSISTCSVVELPESLTQLYALEKLDLHDCKFLLKLPKSFGTLLYLAELDLSYCSLLKYLPDSFGQLQSLEQLNLSYCLALKQLPTSFVCLVALKKATFSHCRNMHKLPEKFELLSSLKEVDFSYCKNLKMLPLNFEQLYSLELLNIDCCSKLEKLPDSFPERLFNSDSVAIKMSGCSSMIELQDEFCQGNQIEDLSLVCWTKIQRLPSKINQLKRLRNLNLSGCQNLRKLPKSFVELARLQVLNLSSCRKLRDLCKGFNNLEALKDLNLSECPSLNGKWMKTVKRIKSLRIVDIHGSNMLISRWSKRQPHFTVITGEEMPVHYKQKILSNTASLFFKDKATLVGKNGRQFFPSREIEAGKTLALVFDHNISRWDWERLENNVDNLLTELMGMQVIYIGKSFSRIPSKLADKITAYTPDNSEALSLFDKLLSITAGPDFWDFRSYIIKTTVVQNQLDYKQFEGWESSSGALVGKNFRIEDYHRLEEMIGKGPPQNSIDELLQALFKIEEDELLMFKGNIKVTINDLRECIVFLLISTLNISQTQILFLKEIYGEMQNKEYGFKIQWVWVPVGIADRDTWISNCDEKKKDMPWVVISDPRFMDQSTITIFFKERMCFCEMPILVSLDKLGHISGTDVMPMVAKLGSEAWLFLNNDRFSPKESNESLCDGHFSKKYKAELDDMKSLSHLHFLFRHFQGIDQSPSQMIWLYGGDPEKISEFNSKLSSVKSKMDRNCRIRIVYVGRGRLLRDFSSIEEENALHKNNTDSIEWLTLSFPDVKKFWHYIHYLVYLIAFKKKEEIKNEEEKKKLESLFRLLLGLLSFNCLSRRNGTVWMMVFDGSSNEIFTGRGKELVDLLSNNIAKSIKSSIEIRDGEGEVHSYKIEEGQLLQGPLIEVIPTRISTSSELEDGKTFEDERRLGEQLKKETFEDAIWFRAHPSSHLVEQISAHLYCSMCCSENTAYHCEICGCFSICQKCYISEFIGRRKSDRGEQINIEVSSSSQPSLHISSAGAFL